MTNNENELIEKALNGDSQALGELLMSVRDMVYNMSLRMLGSIQDAEDAVSEIMLTVITKLSTFQRKSAFSTWVYRITTNYLINCKKTMFAQRPLSFEFYADDINAGFIPNTDDLLQGVEENILAEELKCSCTNVMLQCLDPDSRCIYVLGIMFKADSKICGEILDITPEAYRQRLTRIRKRVSEFLRDYCEISGTGKCNCRKRVGFAIKTHRLNPQNLEYSNLPRLEDDTVAKFSDAMDKMDGLSYYFSEQPKYRSEMDVTAYLKKILNSECMKTIRTEV